MESSFLIKLLVSFLVGGTWSILATVLADRVGPKVGGLIIGLPSTVIFGLLFLSLTQSPSFAVQATTIIPAGVAFTNLFLLSYIYLVRRLVLWLSLGTALSVWFVPALAFAYLGFNNYLISLLVYVLSVLISLWLLESAYPVKSVKGQKLIYSSRVIGFRGFLGGLIVSLVVIIGRFGGPVFGGVFSTLPALFTSTILITYFSQGPEFSAAMMKSTLFSAASLVVYSIGVRYTYLTLGVLSGTLVSIFISFMVGYLIYRFLLRRLA